MIDWTTIDAAIVTAIKAASPDGSSADVRWKWQPNAWRQNQAIILDRSPMRGFGRDERRRAYNAVNDNLDATQCGPRAFSVTIRVESLKAAAGLSALAALECIRTRLYRPSIIEPLRAAKLALSSFGPIARTDYRSDGRDVSVALLEAVFLVAENDSDTTADTYIAEAHLVGDLTGPGGTPHEHVDKVVP